MTGTNRPPQGNGSGNGLIDIPKLDAQRKEQIRRGILTGIRSWTKKPDEPERTEQIVRRRWKVGASLGAGSLALALGVGIWVATNEVQEPSHIAGSPLLGAGLSPYEDELSSAGVDMTKVPEGLADSVLPLTYTEFRSRWEANANSEQVAITMQDQKGEVRSGALPRLDETQQSFGMKSSGYAYQAWSNQGDRELREIVFRLGETSDGVAQNPADVEVIRYATTVLQPELTEPERDALLDRLRFRDFEAKGGARIAEQQGLVYTLDRSGEHQRLIVQFMRAEDQPDELGKWQDSLLDIVR